MKIAIGSDHAGFAYKELIREILAEQGHQVQDLGTYSDEPVDYPQWIRPVAEGSGENLFIVRHGVIKTPPLGSVLEGITRDSIIQIARDKGIEVIEQSFTRDELYIADEAFMTGTAAEVTPIREVDGREIGSGSRGPITKTLQATFFDAVKGRESKYEAWLTAV